MVRGAAVKALSDLLEPLAGFALDAGISTNELQTLIRIATVKSVANRQRELRRRINISGIAASTGLSRSEISRILNKTKPEQVVGSDRQLQATNRVLKMWHYDPNYTNSHGQPADLNIFGSGQSFDSLVIRYGRGIPTRAMLDELSRTGSVEILGTEKVRVKTLLALDRGASSQAIRAFGDRAAALMSNMLSNMRGSDQHQFISTIEGEINEGNLLPLMRREVSSKATDFLVVMRDRLFGDNSNGHRRRKSRDTSTVSVTVFYHEKAKGDSQKKQPTTARQNLRRMR